MEACQGHGIPLKIARGFSFAGPRLPENAGFAMADFIADARAGRKITVKGDGTPVRSYLHAADMAAWLWGSLMENSRTAIFNLGSEEPIRLVDLAARIGKISNIQINIGGHHCTGIVKNDVYFPLLSARSYLTHSHNKRKLEIILFNELAGLNLCQ